MEKQQNSKLLQKNVLLTSEDIALLDDLSRLSGLKTGDVVSLLLHEAKSCDELMKHVGRQYIKRFGSKPPDVEKCE